MKNFMLQHNRSCLYVAEQHIGWIGYLRLSSI